jgi:hypothetical protein
MAKFRAIPSNPFDVQKAVEHYPSATSWADISDAMGLSDRWRQSQWAQAAFEQVKLHGIALAQTLELPKIRKIRDLFDSMRLEGYNSNRTPDGYGKPYPNGGGQFISGRGEFTNYAPHAIAPFFYPNATRYIRTRADGSYFCQGLRADTSQLLTVGLLRKEFYDIAGPQSGGSFEFIRHENGKLLVIRRSDDSIFSSWVAYLDAGETPFSMLSDADKAAYLAAKNRADVVASCVDVESGTVDFAKAALHDVPIIRDKY